MVTCRKCETDLIDEPYVVDKRKIYHISCYSETIKPGAVITIEAPEIEVDTTEYAKELQDTREKNEELKLRMQVQADAFQNEIDVLKKELDKDLPVVEVESAELLEVNKGLKEKLADIAARYSRLRSEIEKTLMEYPVNGAKEPSSGD